MSSPPGSREIIRRLLKDGWHEVAVKGRHHQFKHPEKPGRVTVQHPMKQLGWAAWRGIQKQAGWK